MLKKANEITKGINWHHGNAGKMPFPDSFFDVILCQQGLQYFPDPLSALEKMKRVLAENGRILLSVWRPVKDSPFYETLCKALEKFVNKQSALILSAAFTSGDSKRLRSLFDNAGFQRIHIDIVIKQMRYSPFEEFVMGGIKTSPFFKDIVEMEKAQRDRMMPYLNKSNRNYPELHG